MRWSTSHKFNLLGGLGAEKQMNKKKFFFQDGRFYMCIIMELRWSFWYNIHWVHPVCELI